MQMIRYRPAPPLDRFVDTFWWSRREVALGRCETMLPTGGAQLLFALHDSPIACLPAGESRRAIHWSGGVLHGPQWGHYVAGPKPAGAILGVAFRPGCVAAVLGAPAAEFADAHVLLGDLWGRYGDALYARLRDTDDPFAQFAILERDLIARIERRLIMHPAVAEALRQAAARVGQVQRATGYSPRHFIALFRAATGLTPKHYFRLQRFGAAATAIATGEAGLADVAAATGYADQAHLTREFRDLAGFTPGRYRPAAPDRPMHHLAADMR